MLAQHFSHYYNRRCQRMVSVGTSRCDRPLMPWSHQNLCMIPALELLKSMITNRCWPTTFHIVSTRDVNGWYHIRPAWLAPRSRSLLPLPPSVGVWIFTLVCRNSGRWVGILPYYQCVKCRASLVTLVIGYWIFHIVGRVLFCGGRTGQLQPLLAKGKDGSTQKYEPARMKWI